MPFAKPTGYGLGKSGWVSTSFDDGDQDPVPLLLEWIDESYRAVAPKRLVKTLPEVGPPEDPPAEAPIPDPTRGPVLLVGYDPLRAARAVRAFARLAVSSAEPRSPGEAALAAAARERPIAIVVDVGRNPTDGIDFAGSIAATEFGALPLAVVGIRDAKMERRIREAIPGAALYSREPPGDPRVVRGLIDTL
jgi:CheY-like chemotaxis protein